MDDWAGADPEALPEDCKKLFVGRRGLHQISRGDGDDRNRSGHDGSHFCPAQYPAPGEGPGGQDGSIECWYVVFLPVQYNALNNNPK